MKLHKNLALGIISGLEAILAENLNANDVVRRLLKSNSSWGSRDRKTVAKILYDIIRWKRLYLGIVDLEGKNNNDSHWGLIACWMVLNDHQLPDWEVFSKFKADGFKEKHDALIKIRKYKQAIPDWLDEKGVEAFGEAFWEKEINTLNEPAKLVVRVNRLKTTPEKLKYSLHEKYGFNTKGVSELPDALEFESHQSLINTVEYREGHFEIQDGNSQMIAPWLQPKAGELYFDCCAGAGGKSLHLANLTHDKSQIIAFDIFSSKLVELKRRADRNGIKSIKTYFVNDENKIDKFSAKGNGVLIDAPCSGLGVLKRNPDAKWLMNPNRMKEIQVQQKKILQNYSKLVMPGGKLVYATCSIFPEENRMQVDNFLTSESGKDFTLAADKTYFSQESGYDGFYAALMVKKM